MSPASYRGRGTSRNCPSSWGQPQGDKCSEQRRAWVARNLTVNPKFKLEQLAQAQRRQIRTEIEQLDVKLKAMGITPPPLDIDW
ncbi:hypothetical protein [Propionicimonas sp.]|uniref:hypothetical protein n=1 Tax=Propionicimonas sp. TaxID=1955623 RepID=UPI0017A39BB2|nr:hypothetical protein [Propionicimonas sp.]MBA3021426.1 hypothetical protein [Propionicimonas sp.]